ncbi:MAG: hypothetical protein R3D30_05570 [Hyphomicrobiales bacterium]
MPDLPTGNAVIGQSGGPTAVINQSLAGVVEGLKQGLAASGQVRQILGMRHGVRGIAKGTHRGLGRSWRDSSRDARTYRRDSLRGARIDP